MTSDDTKESPTIPNVASKPKKSSKPTVTSNNTPIKDPHLAYILKQKTNAELLQHQLARNYFKARQFRMFTFPLGVLTLLSSILSFLATSALVKSGDSTTPPADGGRALNSTGFKSVLPEVLTLTVGILTAISVFIQRLSEYNNYGQRATMHETMVFNLRMLRNRLDQLQQKLKQHIQDREERRHDDDPDNDDEFGWLDPNESFEAIEKRKEEFLSACKSDIPVKIANAFRCIRSELRVKMKMDVDHGRHPPEFIQLFETRAYDMLSMRIASDGRFPFYIPNTKIVVDQIMDELQKDMDKYDKYEGDSKTKSGTVGKDKSPVNSDNHQTEEEIVFVSQDQQEA